MLAFPDTEKLSIHQAQGKFCLYISGLVRGWNRFRFLRFHFLTAAGKLTGAGFGAERFGVAFGAAISFT